MTSKVQERIGLIDSLRGYALMGLFLVHMVEYYELYWYSPPAIQEPATTWMFNLFGGKAYAMFALLFGASFYIILSRNAERGIDFRWRFLWRITLLFIIGYVHGLIYSGEVLQVLAVAGLLLLPLWTAPRWLVLIISALLLLQATTYGFVLWIAHSNIAYDQPFFQQIQKDVYEFYAHGSFAQVVVANATGGTLGKWCYMLESGRFANIVGLSLLGFWLAKINFFTDVNHYGRRYLPLLMAAILIALGCYYGQHLFVAIPHAEKVDDAWKEILEMYFNTALAFVSLLVIVLLYQYRVSQQVLKWLAAPGRMTLSFYVGQSLIGVPFFYNFGIGAYHSIGQAGALLLGIVLWVLQVILAHWWLKRFNYGPLEWCWRAATYGTTRISFRNQPG